MAVYKVAVGQPPIVRAVIGKVGRAGGTEERDKRQRQAVGDPPPTPFLSLPLSVTRPILCIVCVAAAQSRGSKRCSPTWPDVKIYHSDRLRAEPAALCPAALLPPQIPCRLALSRCPVLCGAEEPKGWPGWKITLPSGVVGPGDKYTAKVRQFERSRYLLE